ncbi:MAG: hypothetical protein LRY53_05335 [Burkholderiaceae bacterium]|nr:hypothetical protein [Burkholderiaceae bacterium]MCD8516461.1 hypothetical protein [Burkholderiaceae bacterium]MCD8537267.1 hypothetical protein [Burkholderiaceae bacterium]MCD8565060.1 hypothetical protein [Burkholderiaceae bacterium]
MVSFLGDAGCFWATVLVAALAVALVVADLGAALLAGAFTGLALAALPAEDLATVAFLAAGLTVALLGFAAVAATVFFLVVVSVVLLVWRRVVIIVPWLVQVIRINSPPYRRRRKIRTCPIPGLK